MNLLMILTFGFNFEALPERILGKEKKLAYTFFQDLTESDKGIKIFSLRNFSFSMAFFH